MVPPTTATATASAPAPTDQPSADAPPGTPPATPAGLPDFEALVRELEAPLLRYTQRFVRQLEVAQDLVQEAFLRLFREARRPGGFEGTPASWLYRVVHNLAMDHLRREGRARAHQEREMHQPQAVAAPPPDLARRDAGRLAREKLATLSDREQQIVVLKVEQDLSYKEIAEIMQLTVGNVGYILHHALKKLANILRGGRLTRGLTRL